MLVRKGVAKLDRATEDGFSNPYSSVVEEIDNEAERLRASGAMPEGMEEELDELFWSLVPFSGTGGRFGDGITLAEKAAHFDLDVPVGSRLLGGSVVKRLIAKAVRWYMSYLSTQMTKFAALIIMLARILEERVTAIEEEVGIGRTSPVIPELHRHEIHERERSWGKLVLEESRNLPGRLLHAECGDGWLVKELTADGVDAYGVDPNPSLLTTGRSEGLQLFPVAPMEHLIHLPDESLGALVLSGFVETLALSQIIRLVELAAAKVVDEGKLFVISLYPETFYRLASPVELDLAVGHPLHPETWQLLLEQGGFEGVAVHSHELVGTGRGGDGSGGTFGESSSPSDGSHKGYGGGERPSGAPSQSISSTAVNSYTVLSRRRRRPMLSRTFLRSPGSIPNG